MPGARRFGTDRSRLVKLAFAEERAVGHANTNGRLPQPLPWIRPRHG